MMVLATRPFDPVAYLDTAEARVAYLADAFATNDPAEVTEALGVVARAAGMGEVAELSGRKREALYRALSKDGNPEFRTVLQVMKALGMRLAPIKIPA